MKTSTVEIPYLAQENQAIKRQKLEGGKSKQKSSASLKKKRSKHSSKSKEAMSQQIDEVVFGSALSLSSEFELPKGRAIQVEDNMIECKPSMDVKRPRN